MAISAYIENLFTYLDRFEDRPAEIDTEAFVQTYSGIYAVFQALRKERDRATEIDQFFLSKIKATPLNKSDLRQVTVQLLVTYFEVESDVDGQSNQAYLYCRGQRELRQDAPFFESHLAPKLFSESGLGQNQRLVEFLLDEIVRYMNRYGSRIPVDLTPEQFDRLTESSKFLMLARRRLELGKDLARERGSLEHQLLQFETFRKLAARGRIQRELLSGWDYLQTTSFWSRLFGAIGDSLGRLGGAFKSWRYFRHVIRERNTAYLFYSIIIVLAIALAIWVPSKWLSYTDTKLQQLEQHAGEIQAQSGR